MNLKFEICFYFQEIESSIGKGRKSGVIQQWASLEKCERQKERGLD